MVFFQTVRVLRKFERITVFKCKYNSIYFLGAKQGFAFSLDSRLKIHYTFFDFSFSLAEKITKKLRNL